MYFAAFAKTIFFYVNSPHKKIKSKIIENLPFCIQDISYHMGVAMACTMYTLSCYEGPGDMLP